METESFNFNEYQKFAMKTAPDGMSKRKIILNGVMGLCGEAGECIDIVKKAEFQGHELDETNLINEASDCLWYLAQIATGLGINLEDIARYNISKLAKRYPNGFETEKSINRIQENTETNDIHTNNPWYKLKGLNRNEIFDAVRQYDRYIQAANDANRYREGWRPVCFAEFYDCEYQQYLEYEKDIKNGNIYDDSDFWSTTEK